MERFDRPLSFMDQVVMPGAEQYAVVDAGGSACRPGNDVVGFAPGGRHRAVGEGTAPVTCYECPPQVRWKEALGSPDVEDLARAAEHEWQDVGVACEPPDASSAQLLREDGVTVMTQLAEEVAMVDGHHDLGSVPSGRGKSVAGERDAAGRDQSVEQVLSTGGTLGCGLVPGARRLLPARTRRLIR